MQNVFYTLKNVIAPSLPYFYNYFDAREKSNGALICNITACVV